MYISVSCNILIYPILNMFIQPPWFTFAKFSFFISYRFPVVHSSTHSRRRTLSTFIEIQDFFAPFPPPPARGNVMLERLRMLFPPCFWHENMGGGLDSLRDSMSRQDGGFEGGGVIHSRLMILEAVTLRVLRRRAALRNGD